MRNIAIYLGATVLFVCSSCGCMQTTTQTAWDHYDECAAETSSFRQMVDCGNARFKYTDQAIKGMMDNPQNRAAAAAKLAEAFGGKLEAIYFFPMGGEFDGIAIDQAPSDSAIEALQFVGRSSGAFAKGVVVPIIASGEFKTLMETAKQGAASYAPPGR